MHFCQQIWSNCLWMRIICTICFTSLRVLLLISWEVKQASKLSTVASARMILVSLPLSSIDAQWPTRPLSFFEELLATYNLHAFSFTCGDNVGLKILSPKSYSNKSFITVFTSGQFWTSGIVVACVCASVRSCVKREFFRAITHDPFTLRSPNFDLMCKTPLLSADWPWPSRSNLTQKSNFTQFWALSLFQWLVFCSS